MIALLDRLELALPRRRASSAGLVVHDARARRASRSVTARRQLRWIVWGTALGAVPFALGYALPLALGVDAVAADASSSAIPLGFVPLAFASAIVRYRLMDVEVIIKRGLVYTAVVGGDRRDLRRSC